MAAQLLVTSASPTVQFGLAVLSMILAVCSGAAAMMAFVGQWRERPASLVVEPRAWAFRTPPHRGQLYLTIALVFLGAGQVGPWWRILRHPPSPAWFPAGAWVTLIVLVAVAVGVNVVVAWRATGVRLRPDGVVNSTGLGTLTVPWDALAPGYPLLSSPAAAASGTGSWGTRSARWSCQTTH